MKILITGCYGFIGFNFLHNIQKNYPNQFEVIGLDKLTNQFSKNNYEILPLKNFYKVDLQEINNIDLPKVDMILNFAAESHVDNSISNPNLFVNSNITGTINLMKFGIKNNIENFVHISTDEVYGSLVDGFADENFKFNPSSPYSGSKASAEIMAKTFSKTYDYPIKIIRPANNYGIYQQPEKLIPFSIINLLRGGIIELYGDGKNIRHWLHVDDTCSAIFTIIEKGLTGEAYNIGSNYYMSNLELSYKLVKYMNLNEDRIKFVSERPGHDFRYAVNISKLENLGWKSSMDFDIEIEKIINWYKLNTSWWEDGLSSIFEKRNLRLSLE